MQVKWPGDLSLNHYDVYVSILLIFLSDKVREARMEVLTRAPLPHYFNFWRVATIFFLGCLDFFILNFIPTQGNLRYCDTYLSFRLSMIIFLLLWVEMSMITFSFTLSWNINDHFLQNTFLSAELWHFFPDRCYMLHPLHMVKYLTTEVTEHLAVIS